MKRRLTHVMTSAVLTGAMVLSMSGMSALAEETSDVKEITEVPFVKTVTTDGKTFAPSTEFTFELVSGAAVTEMDAMAGVDGGIEIDGTFVFAPDESDLLTDAIKRPGTIKVNLDKFDTVGAYHYVVKEVVPVSEDDKYPGVVYDENVYHIYVTILTKDDGTLYCGGIKTTANDSDEKSANGAGLEFVNNYGKDDEGGGDKDKVHDVTVTKKVTGNKGDKTKDFEFTLEVAPDVEKEWFNCVITRADGTEESKILKSEAGKLTVTLKDGESVKVYGLTKGDALTVLENSKYQDEEGYTVTTSVDGQDAQKAAGVTELKVEKDGTLVTVENNKVVDIATGVALTFGPYAIMVMIAGVFATMFLRKKNSLEEL